MNYETILIIIQRCYAQNMSNSRIKFTWCDGGKRKVPWCDGSKREVRIWSINRIFCYIYTCIINVGVRRDFPTDRQKTHTMTEKVCHRWWRFCVHGTSHIILKIIIHIEYWIIRASQIFIFNLCDLVKIFMLYLSYICNAWSYNKPTSKLHYI